MPPELPPIPSIRKTGRESLHDDGVARHLPLSDFWSWSASSLLSNATRGILAEYIVGLAIHAVTGCDVRDEWADYDLTTPSGVRAEVKSSAYVQAWHQKDYSTPTFSVRKTKSWDAETGETGDTPSRQADVYVFALLTHQDQDTIDPLNLRQCSFFVCANIVPRSAREKSALHHRALVTPALKRPTVQ